MISFHSLEDRIVKQFMQRHAKAPPSNRRLPEAAAFVPTLRLHGGAIKAEADELAVNPRARSAVLRVAEKLGLEIGDSGFEKSARPIPNPGSRIPASPQGDAQ